MTTILAIFVIALVLSLVLAPLASRFGLRYGAVDEPDERKVHSRPC
jgi:UDP-N-acetylmuramyl pentapeptide phosphotransferase/UDP-N-acetylglucosamine-1-phosphate transferase